MEFLIGRTLSNACCRWASTKSEQRAGEMRLNLEELIDEENDPGLGIWRCLGAWPPVPRFAGGPGRCLAVVTVSAMTTGMFKQNIVDGQQKESPDYWLE